MSVLRHLLGKSPFAGDLATTRVRLFDPRSSRPTLPFPHPWNYQHPLRILDTYFHNADAEPAPQRHNRYLKAPGFAPVLVTRDPRIIRAIATETGDKPGQFDRDTMPSVGIARATGEDTLLYANGAMWKRQKKLSTPPFARTTLFQPEQFQEFASTFRHTVRQRLDAMQQRLERQATGDAGRATDTDRAGRASAGAGAGDASAAGNASGAGRAADTKGASREYHAGGATDAGNATAAIDATDAARAEATARLRVQLEPEIKAVMLEMLVNNFFGADVPYAQIRQRYVPALDCVIDHIIRDTVINKLGFRVQRLPSFCRAVAEIKDAYAGFEQLTDLVIATRRDGRGLWKQFKSDAPDAALRSNIKVFLAGALEATTSYASWAISHLARNPAAQEKLRAEVATIDDYTPGALENAKYLGHVLDETLRLTPSLYFLPRRATADTWVETNDGSKLWMPKGTHVLLDVWHANRHEDHWGVGVTGYPALDFVPERWENLKRSDRDNKEYLHFGFGHGPRFCPGKSLGQLEVGLVVGAFVKLFRFEAVHRENEARAGVSTKPADGVLIALERIAPAVTSPAAAAASRAAT